MVNWLSLGAYLLTFALGAGAAWPLATNTARAPLQTQVAELGEENAALRGASAEAARLAALAVADKLQRAQQSGQAASERLAAALATNQQLTQEKRHAIQLATDGRACLSERALGVLNGATGITVAHAAPAARLPAPASQPAAASGATAPLADPGRETTDTQLADWIATAGQQYEACRRRLGELITWTNANTGTPAALPPEEPPEGRDTP